MRIDQLINILANVTLIEMMVTVGLGAAIADVARVAGDGRLMLRAAIANYVCVPAICVGLLLAFARSAPDPAAFPLIAAGFLIPAVCPGAPYGPPFTAIARGNVATAVGLMVTLAASSAIAAPLLLRGLLPVVAGDAPIRIDAIKMLLVLFVTQLCPLALGLWLRAWKPALAERLKRPAGLCSMLLNLALLTLIIVAQFRMLLDIPLRAYAGMFALVSGSAAVGWLLGGRSRGERVAMTMASAVRNVGLSLVIATTSFPGTPAVAATTAFALFQTIVMALAAAAWGRMAAGVGRKDA
jgi:BASS family bile acid:Na+ symporter